jgi:hypothetical protein
MVHIYLVDKTADLPFLRVKNADGDLLPANVSRDTAPQPPRDDCLQQDPPRLHAHQVL